MYQSSLLGTFVITNAVWPIMRQQRYGRILNCVSGAGLYGNFGQVNYAAAKMGLVGFTVALNREGMDAKQLLAPSLSFPLSRCGFAVPIRSD